MKKHIRINFVDFWENFDPEKSLFYNILSQRYEIELSKKPDYLFCSVFGQDHLKYDCIKIFYTGENQCADFNLYDYAIGFDYLDFGDRYLRFPLFYLYRNDFSKMMEKHLHTNNILSEKSGFCSFVVSNNHSSPERNSFFDKLSQYKQISSGGRFRNNIGGPVSNKLEFQSKHKFALAFENCSHPGYCTEKLIQAFAAQTVPIYWGDPKVSESFNEKAFVNCMSYSSFEEVIEEIKRIDNDDKAYTDMLSTPALLSETDTIDSKYTALSDFLYKIFDPPIEKAKRCNTFYWGGRYLKIIQSRERAYRHSFKGQAESLYKHVLWRYKRKNNFFYILDRFFKNIFS